MPNDFHQMRADAAGPAQMRADAAGPAQVRADAAGPAQMRADAAGPAQVRADAAGPAQAGLPAVAARLPVAAARLPVAAARLAAGAARLAAGSSVVRLPATPAGRLAVTIEPMTGSHASEVLAIYRAGIDEGNATFEVRAPDWDEFSAARLPEHRFVALDQGTVVGWVAVSAYSSRCVYAGVVEHSVYVHPRARGAGVGRCLLETLIASTEAAGIWTIQSGIFPENVASIALHAAVGFRIVGTRERVGQQHGRWRDILLLERRSPVI